MKAKVFMYKCMFLCGLYLFAYTSMYSQECCNSSDIVIQLQSKESCDTTVYFEVPNLNLNCPTGGSFTQISGPTSDSAPGAGDGTVLYPGRFTVEYKYDFSSQTFSCSQDIVVLPFPHFQLACKDLNVSLNQNCESVLTPFTVLIGNDLGCEENYEVSITDEHGREIGNVVTDQQLGETLTYNVCLVGGANCCWGELFVEDKFPPQIICPDGPISVPCNQLEFIDLDVSNDNCTNQAELIITNENYIDIECDPKFVAKVIRTYIAVDGNGASSLPCTVEIYLERILFDNIVLPDDRTIFNDNALCCDQSNWIPDSFGYPDPVYGPCPEQLEDNPDYEWNNPYSNSTNNETESVCTGSGSGVPTYLGYPLYPESIGHSCNLFTHYTDEVLQQTDCKTKIVRTWTFREWHCTDEFFQTEIQIIELIDKTGPILSSLGPLFASTAWGCEGGVVLPPIEAWDDCSDEFTYFIEYPGGSLTTNGGLASIPVGTHTIRYTVFDACNNSSYEETTIVIQDMLPPVAICESTKVVAINHSGNVPVWAESFDNGSWDDCFLDRFEVRRMETTCDTTDLYFGEEVSFCCADVGNPVMVVFRVYDGNGLFNDCMVEVNVQDKIDPEITCPDDMTISCLDNFDINNPNDFFGEPYIDDNCATPENVSQKVTMDIDDCMTGTLIREIYVENEDGSIASSCIQNIYVFPENSFDEEDITWPLDYAGEGCDVESLEPDFLPFENGNPIVEKGECDLVGYNYEDQILEFTQGEGACLKIIRHWTVINWCEERDEVFTTFEYYQEIKIINELPPTFDNNCETIVNESNDPDCGPEHVIWSMNAMDDCTMDLDWKFELDLFSDNVIDSVGFSEVIEGNFPAGTHVINWRVEDRCGNFNFCSQTAIIKNTKAPTAVCINGLSVDLVPMDFDSDGVIDNEMATIWASDFDASSFHPCGDDFVFSFSQDTTDIFLELDCSDVGEVIVELWATSTESGAGSFCTTFVDVQDNNSEGFCDSTNPPTDPPTDPTPPTDGNGSDGSGSSSRLGISGSVHTELGLKVPEVEIGVQGGNVNPALTNEQGEYSFPDMPSGGSYVIVPKKDVQYLNGVSTLDVVLIQRHILGLENIDSPYSLIAADANNSKTISSADLIDLRKLILGIIDDLPNVDSWRFVSKDHEFMEGENPFDSAFQEDYSIFNLEEDMWIEFVGIKVGDVNRSVALNFSNNSIDQRSNVEWKYEIEQSENRIAIYSNDRIDTYGFQASLMVAGEEIQITGIEGGQLDFNENNYRLFEGNEIAISYSDGNRTKVDQETPLFHILTTGKMSSLEIQSNEMKSEWYDQDMHVQNIQVEEKSSSYVQLGKVIPNPWSGQTSFNIAMEKEQNLEIEIFDFNGKIIYKDNVEAKVGNNEVIISSQNISQYGALMLIVKGDNFNETKRMIHIR